MKYNIKYEKTSRGATMPCCQDDISPNPAVHKCAGFTLWSMFPWCRYRSADVCVRYGYKGVMLPLLQEGDGDE